MKKALLLLCIIASVTAPAKTQISFGPEVGVNISNYYGKTAGVKRTFLTSVTGARLGGVADIGFNKNVSLQPGLCYARNGYNAVLMDFAGNIFPIEVRISTIELPINLLYKIPINSGGQIFLGFGPYFAANVSGRVRSELNIVNRHATIGTNPTDDLKPIDMGLGVSAGYQLPGNLFVHLHYQHSTINELPGGNADNTMYNVNYGVALGYLFGRNATVRAHTTVRKQPAPKHR